MSILIPVTTHSPEVDNFFSLLFCWLYNGIIRRGFGVSVAMYTKATDTIDQEKESIIIPPLPPEAVLRLPAFVKPNKNNLATQYYFFNREMTKENAELRGRIEKLNEELQRWKEKVDNLEQEKDQLKSERDKFREMLFKFNHKKHSSRVKHEPVLRTKESYVRQIPVAIDEYRECKLNQCPHCNGILSKQIDVYQRIIEDIPDYEQLKAKTIQYSTSRYFCKNCNKIVSAKPANAIPKSRLGINTLLYVLHSKYRLRLSHDLIRENLNTQFNLKISNGEITNLLEKGSQVFQNKWQEIIEMIKHSKSSNDDETSWKIGKDKSWLWAFVGDKAVRYKITESRGKGVAAEALGKDYEGVVGCDFYSAYNQFKNKQRCWVHLLRRARELVQDKPTDISRLKIKNKLSSIYNQILLFRLNENTTQYIRNEKAEQIKNQLQNIQTICRIKSGEKTDKNLQKLLNLCKKFAGELVTCVSDFSVPPENNTAERAIRPAVLMRKISGGSRSLKGAKIHETNLSVLETLNRENKKQDIFPAMKNLVLNYLASGE